MKIFLLFAILMYSVVVCAQSKRDLLKLDIQNSIIAYNESDYETVLKYLPDFVFDNISQEQIIKEISKRPISKLREITRIKIDTILIIELVEYARFYIDSGKATYGIKNEGNMNWTFIDLNEETKKYLPVQIRKSTNR